MAKRRTVFTGLVAHELVHMVLDNANYRNETGGIPINATLQSILRRLYPLPRAMAGEGIDGPAPYSLLSQAKDMLTPSTAIITPADWMPDDWQDAE